MAMADVLRCEMEESFGTLSDKQAQSVTGNSMHLRAIGAALLFCFGCSQRGRLPEQNMCA